MTLLSRVRPSVVLAGLLCVALSGCGTKPIPFAENAEGTLTWGNKPLAGVRVQFVPQAGQGTQATLSSATTDEKGYFQLKRDDNGQPGAVIGKHKVVLVSGRMGGGPESRDDGGKEVRQGVKVPQIYSGVSTTPLGVEVKADQKTYPLEIE